MARKKIEKPEDPRQKLVVWIDGKTKAGEWRLDPTQKIINVDLYLEPIQPKFDISVANYPAERADAVQ